MFSLIGLTVVAGALLYLWRKQKKLEAQVLVLANSISPPDATFVVDRAIERHEKAFHPRSTAR